MDQTKIIISRWQSKKRSLNSNLVEIRRNTGEIAIKIDDFGSLQRAKTISYKWKFIGSARFMVNSLSNLIDNLAAGTHKMNNTRANMK